MNKVKFFYYFTLFCHFSSSAEKGLEKNIIDLEKMCKEKDHQIDELYKRFAEITIEMDQDKEHIRRLQESLQNYRDEVNTLSARYYSMYACNNSDNALVD